jgi:hypothetical protein
MKPLFSILCFGFLATLACPAIAQQTEKKPQSEKPRVEKPGDGKSVPGEKSKINHPALRAIESIKLSEEQQPKVKAIAGEFVEKMTALREKGYTRQLTKKRAEATKKARQAGKKGNELRAEVMASIDATEEQKGLLKRADEITGKMQQDLAAVLTDEQIESLPPQVKRTVRAAKDRAAGKGKKKKNAD